MLINISKRRETSSRDLVGLLADCHERIRRFVAMAREAAVRRDAPTDQIEQACADVERYFREALPLHVTDEEESVEPRLRGRSPAVDRALDAITLQHEQHAPKLEHLLRVLAEVRNDPQAESARNELETAATNLESDFEEHLALEEKVIFPAIREFLSPETQALIIDELRKRRVPGREIV